MTVFAYAVLLAQGAGSRSNVAPVVLAAALALIVGGLVGALLQKRVTKRRIGSARAQADELVQQAVREAEEERKRRSLELKEEQVRVRAEFEQETRETRKELRQTEKRVQQREENLDRKVAFIDKKEEEVTKREKDVERKASDLDQKDKKLTQLIEEESRQLQRISGMSRAEAREQLLARMEDEVTRDAAALIRRIEGEARETADKTAKKIIGDTLQRIASDYVAEVTVTSVALPNDEMKGRIIGREGRNIRALEAATGIDIIIDDTPEAVILSGFDPVRKEIARIALERLMLDGRIHPARIEEVVNKVRKEMEQTIKEAGEQAAFEVGVHNLHVEIVKALGRLKYRYSYGQNVLRHSIEVAHIMGIMADELGFDSQLAKRIGLLHDVGKSLTHEVEGPHALIGAEFCKRYRESAMVVNGIAAHHMDEEPKSFYGVLSQAADSLSAARPGARSETLSIYIKRLEKLEELAKSFRGIEKAYAMQAGREIRVLVEPDRINDDEALVLARHLSQKIEDELEYPGQIKVTVIRETRAVEYAR
ncbi:MAG: ribonuclease Y [Verrucomicrobia bacterium]|nr:ribonuclease Y [Verrucomicrobiota bacterium]